MQVQSWREEHKARRARLGYVETRAVVPIDLVRPKEPEPPPPVLIEVVEPPKELKFRPALVKLKQPRVQDVLLAVAFEFEVSPADILSASRVKELVTPRHAVAYIARQMTDLSFPVIAQRMNGRDHTCALNSWRKMRQLMAEDEELRDRIGKIMRSIREGLGL